MSTAPWSTFRKTLGEGGAPARCGSASVPVRSQRALESGSVSELILTLSERFAVEDVSSIRAALGRHLRVRDQRFVVRQSIDPPSIIQLLGAVAAWQILVKPAATFIKAFVSALGKKSGEAAWDLVAARKKNDDLKPLVDVVHALVDAAERVGGEVKIGVGLDIPDDHFGTVIWTDSRDPMDVARSLSAFVVRAETISATVLAEIERGNEPIGWFFVELERDDSVMIRWRRASDSKACETRIP